MAPGMRRNRSMPSSRKPEPPSQMNSVSSTRISTHDVLPPYFFDALPGVGIEPRVPQNRTKNATPPPAPPTAQPSSSRHRTLLGPGRYGGADGAGPDDDCP